jgi:hypothetical protein
MDGVDPRISPQPACRRKPRKRVRHNSIVTHRSAMKKWLDVAVGYVGSLAAK